MKLRWLAAIATLALVALLLTLRTSLVRRPSPAPTAPIPTTAAAPARDTGPLHIAVEDAAGPWSQPDGTGFANDVVAAAFKAAGVAMVIDVVPYARCKQMAIDGTVAGCFSMSHAAELDATIAFADAPLFVCDASYFERANHRLRVTNERALRRGTVVGVVLGYEYPASVYQLAKDGVVVLDQSASEEINLRKLADGRLDAAIINVNRIKTGAALIARAGLTGQVELAFAGGTLQSFIGFSRRHPRGIEARDQFNAGYQRIRADGTLAKLEASWIERTSGARRPPSSAPDKTR